MSDTDSEFGSFVLLSGQGKMYADFLRSHANHRERIIDLLSSREQIHSSTAMDGDAETSRIQDFHVALSLQNGEALYHRNSSHVPDDFFTLNEIQTYDFEEHITVDINGLRVWSATHRVIEWHSGDIPALAGPYGFVAWPKSLLQAKTLSLMIQINSCDAGEPHEGRMSLWQIGQLIFSLASFFESGKHNLRFLNLTIDMEGTPDLQTHEEVRDTHSGMTLVQMVLWQLRRIGRIENLTITGLTTENEQFVRMLMRNGQDNRHDRLQGPLNWEHYANWEAESQSAMVKSAIAAKRYPDRAHLLERVFWLLDEVHAREQLLPLLGIRDVAYNASDGVIFADDNAADAAHIWAIFEKRNVIDPFYEYHLEFYINELRRHLDEFAFEVQDIAAANWERVGPSTEWTTYLQRHETRCQEMMSLELKETRMASN